MRLRVARRRPRLTRAQDGYVEGLLRGYRGGMLTAADYNNLSQCENLDDVKLHLARRRFTAARRRGVLTPSVLQGTTDYGPYLANEPSPLHAATIVEKCTAKLVEEWNHLRCQARACHAPAPPRRSRGRAWQAVEPLATFLDYCTYGHMIDNVVLIVAGTLHERDMADLLSKCHPLGMFDSIATLAVATTMRELYRLVLVDTPLAPYFSGCISSEDLDEMNIEVMRATLYKAYLEDFAQLCSSHGGATAALMGDLLDFEADRRAVAITINSLGTELSRDDRAKLFPAMGALYPCAWRGAIHPSHHNFCFFSIPPPPFSISFPYTYSRPQTATRSWPPPTTWTACARRRTRCPRCARSSRRSPSAATRHPSTAPSTRQKCPAWCSCSSSSSTSASTIPTSSCGSRRSAT